VSSRDRLPNRRPCVTFDFRTHKGEELKVSLNNGGTEMFVSGNKSGSDMDALMRDAAIVYSLARQYGCPLETIQGALTRNQDGTASSVIGALIDVITREQAS
jgi:hypothetical protein